MRKFTAGNQGWPEWELERTRKTTARRPLSVAIGGAALLSLLPLAGPLAAAEGCFRGINLSGAEFGQPGGLPSQDYAYPSEKTISYFAAKGFTSVRLPFLWERLQPTLFGDLDAGELLRMDETLVLLRQYGLGIVLDPHNYASYRGQFIGTGDVSNAAFADFWGRLANRYANAADITFGLMNEPHDIPATQWLGAANAAIAAIRGQGADNLVLVPGTSWTGAHSWQAGDPGQSNGEVMLGVEDPADNYAYEVHQYFDDDFSGTKGNCSRGADAVAAITSVTEWLRAHGRRGYLGEFGVPAGKDCVGALEAMVSAVEQGGDVWTGWAYWVAGDWWPATEALNIQPTAEGDRPQLAGLMPALGDSSTSVCPALTGR